MTNKNQGRVRKKSSSRAPNKSKQKKIREKNFNLKTFSMVMMGLAVFLFIFIISSNTGFLGDRIGDIFAKLFGKLSILFPLGLFVSFFMVYKGIFKQNLSRMLLIYGIFLLTLAILSKDFVRNELAWSVEYSAFKKSLGGGWFGGLVGFYILNFIGPLGLYILYITLIGSFIINVSPYSYREFSSKLGMAL